MCWRVGGSAHPTFIMVVELRLAIPKGRSKQSSIWKERLFQTLLEMYAANSFSSGRDNL
jgi:hypothetical protein